MIKLNDMRKCTFLNRRGFRREGGYPAEFLLYTVSNRRKSCVKRNNISKASETIVAVVGPYGVVNATALLDYSYANDRDKKVNSTLNKHSAQIKLFLNNNKTQSEIYHLPPFYYGFCDFKAARKTGHFRVV